jgi:hypothetical protein
LPSGLICVELRLIGLLDDAIAAAFLTGDLVFRSRFSKYL